jgi:hypothetical protein
MYDSDVNCQYEEQTDAFYFPWYHLMEKMFLFSKHHVDNSWSGLFTCLKQLGQVWWCTPAISGTQEVDVEGLWSEASPGQSTRPYLKK